MSIISSLLWKYFERTGNYAIQFIVQIVLARLLVPSDFGMIALLLVFVNLAQVFVQSGFNTALIQRKSADDVDFSSVFYLSLAVSSVLYCILFAVAPYIASFYKMPELVKMLRVLAVILFFGAVNSIQNAVVAREFKFKQLFYSSLGAILFSGSIGVFMSYRNYGVWGLVWQQVTNQIFLCMIMWITVKWRPRLLFSLRRVKVLFDYACKLLASGLLNTLYVEMNNLVIGKAFTSDVLGFYNRGEVFPKVIISNIDGSLQSVMLPAYSREQDSPVKVKYMVRRTITMSSFIIFPLMAGLIATAEQLVSLILTDKWLSCVPFLQISCLSYALMPINTSNLQSINAMGRSDVFLKLEIIKKIYGLAILAVALFYFKSVMAIAWSGVFGGIISSFVNASPNKKILNYGYFEQIKDLLPSFGVAALMGVLTYSVVYLGLSAGITLALQIIAGVVSYTFLSWIFRIDSLRYLASLARGAIGRRA